MTINYCITKNVSPKMTSEIAFALGRIRNSVFIKKDNKCVDGKSLLGLLATTLQKGDLIEVEMSENENVDLVKETFNRIGGEIKTN